MRRLADALARIVIGHVRNTLHHAFRHFGPEKTRRDTVHIDVETRPFHRERFRHAHDARLGDGIERCAMAVIFIGGDAGDIDHAARLLRADQTARDLAGEDVGAAQIGVEDVVDQIERHFGRILRVGNARIVQQDGDGAEFLLRVLHRFHDAVGTRHVEFEGCAFAAFRFDEVGKFGETFLAAAGDGDGCARIGEHAREAPAQTGARPGHEGHLARQVA